MRQIASPTRGNHRRGTNGRMSRPLERIPVDLSGTRIVVTGASAGIGHEAALALAQLGADVTVVARSAAKAAAAIDALVARGAVRARLAGEHADLGKLGEVRALAERLATAHPRLDVLINNAGAGYQERRVTSEGLEATLVVNHLGPFLLTHLLLDALTAAAPSRVIFVSSGLHRMVKLDFEDLQAERKYKGFPDVYGRAKLAVTVCAYALARKLAGSGVVVNVADPGIASTSYADSWTGLTRFFYYTILRPFQSTPDQAARSTVALASDPAFADKTGLYVAPPAKIIKSSKDSYDEAAGQRMFELSTKLVGL